MAYHGKAETMTIPNGKAAIRRIDASVLRLHVFMESAKQQFLLPAMRQLSDLFTRASLSHLYMISRISSSLRRLCRWRFVLHRRSRKTPNATYGLHAGTHSGRHVCLTGLFRLLRKFSQPAVLKDRRRTKRLSRLQYPTRRI